MHFFNFFLESKMDYSKFEKVLGENEASSAPNATIIVIRKTALFHAHTFLPSSILIGSKLKAAIIALICMPARPSFANRLPDIAAENPPDSKKMTTNGMHIKRLISGPATEIFPFCSRSDTTASGIINHRCAWYCKDHSNQCRECSHHQQHIVIFSEFCPKSELYCSKFVCHLMEYKCNTDSYKRYSKNLERIKGCGWYGRTQYSVRNNLYDQKSKRDCNPCNEQIKFFSPGNAFKHKNT